MVTNISIELTDEQRAQLAEQLGMKGMITRKELTQLVTNCIQRHLDGSAQKERSTAKNNEWGEMYRQKATHGAKGLLKDLMSLRKGSGFNTQTWVVIEGLVNISLPNFIKAAGENPNG